MIALAAFLLFWQQAPDRCSVEGQVVRVGTSEPVPKALVVLRRIDGRDTPYAATADASGKFSLLRVEPGRYRLSAEKNGFVRSEFGQRAADRPGTTLTLNPGQEAKDVTIRLTPASVLTGRIVNEEGERVAGARIELERFRYVDGRRQLVPVNSATTNDLGEYRLYGIAPGRYFVSAQYTPVWERYAARPAGAQENSYVPLYYPNTPDPDRAVIIELAPGAELRGIDFSLSPVRTVALRGRVIGPPGRGTSVALLPAEGGSARGSNLHTSTDAQGNFELASVPPGSYYLVAVRLIEGGNFLNARIPVQLGPAGADAIEVPLVPQSEVAGAVKTVDNAPLPKGDLRVIFDSRDSGVSMGGGIGILKPDGTFRAPRMPQGRFAARVMSLPEDYYVRSIRLGGEEVKDAGFTVGPDGVTGLEIQISPAGGRMDGAVVNDQQQPAAGATVVLVPDPERRRFSQYYRQTTADQDGRFSLRGIAPGDYKVFAWDDIEPGAWMDPDFVRTRESAGKSISIGEGAHETVALLLAPGL